MKTALFQRREDMKIVRLTDKQRDKIIKMTKPTVNDYFSYQNLDLLTAAYDEEKKYYLTRTRFMSSAITRTGGSGDEYTFALITPLGCFSVSCAERAGKYSGVFSPLPVIISSESITKLIEFYESNLSARRALIKEASEEFDAGDKSFTEWYLKQNCFEK